MEKQILCCLLYVIFHVMCIDSIPYNEKYFNQTLNHYNYYGDASQPSEFNQRYLFQEKWWQKGGPIFFYTGNEGDIVTFWNNTGFMFELAPKFHALVVFCEHRFYGKSLPFGPDKSYEHPNVDLLTVDQALADFAVFIDWFRRSWNAEDSEIIAFGGSYGGMLSAYMRFHYPNLIRGSLAASAPIYLAAGVGDRTAYFQDVTKDFHDAIPGCDVAVRQGFTQMYQLLDMGDKGYKKLSEAFNLCPPITKREEVDHLVGWIRNGFGSLAMMDYPYATSFMAPLPAFPVKTACEKLMSADEPLTGLAKATAVWYGSSQCSNIWSEYIECADPSGCGLGPAGKAWSYQSCTDFTMPGGTNNKTDMFPYLPFTLQDRASLCRKRWGVTPPTDWPRIQLWGKDISSASNIVFSNGKLDPWHRGGVLESLSDTLVAIVIDNAAHHLDLRSSHPDDPASVIKARQIETDWIHKWLQQKHTEL